MGTCNSYLSPPLGVGSCGRVGRWLWGGGDSVLTVTFVSLSCLICRAITEYIVSNESQIGRSEVVTQFKVGVKLQHSSAVYHYCRLRIASDNWLKWKEICLNDRVKAALSNFCFHWSKRYVGNECLAKLLFEICASLPIPTPASHPCVPILPMIAASAKLGTYILQIFCSLGYQRQTDLHTQNSPLW